jgi:inosine/xanthosine triphosphate pyrophosphatase family protein
MSNKIGDLFKLLSKNEIFTNYLKDIEHNKTNEDIINSALNNEQLMQELTNIVDDVGIIKNKMDIIIGQKRKNYEKEREKLKEKNEILEDVQNIEESETIEFKYLPINPEKVVWLNNYTYLERIDHMMRLVTTEYEMYY